jgi:cobalt/nickel transport system permease protein
MIDHWLGHHHSHYDSPVSRLPAAPKLALALAIIVATVLMPPRQIAWYLGVAFLLALAAWGGRVPVSLLFRRLAFLSPLILSVALVRALQPGSPAAWWTVAAKSSLCLVTVILVSNTTPFTKLLRVLRQVHVPALLITTIALMHRYLFVLADEAERMRRARASRTFTPRRPALWHTLATVLSQLFVRASERAERIYDAMCARGWK